MRTKSSLKAALRAAALSCSLLGGLALAGGTAGGYGGSGETEREAETRDLPEVETGIDASELGEGGPDAEEEGTGGSGNRGDERTRTSDSGGLMDTLSNQDGLERLPQTELRVNAGVGIGNFLGDLDEVTQLGPTWQVVASGQEYRLIGVEVGYEGGRNSLEDGRLDDSAAVWRHGVGALVKVGPLIEPQERSFSFRPFVGTGVGVGFINPNDEAESLYSNDVLAEIPVAAGLELQRNNLVAGIRASYDFLLSEEFAETALGVDDSEGGFASAQVTIGGRF